MENAKPTGRMSSSTIRSHTGPDFWKVAVVLQINRIVEAQHVIHHEQRSILEELEAVAGEGDFTATPRPAPAALFRPDGVTLFHQQEADCHFLLIAIRHVLRTAKNLRGDHRVAQADDSFKAAFSHAGKLRDILEHLDEYERGEGKLQKSDSGIDPDDRGVFIRSDADDLDSEIYYHFGFGVDIPLKAAAAAAVELAELVETVEDERNGS